MPASNHIKKIAIVGAGGQIGKFVTAELLKTGRFQVTAITRTSSPNDLPSGVEVRKIDYDNKASVVSALQGHDAFIMTMSVMAPKGQEALLIEAAAEANIPWILPNEWGGDLQNTQLGHDTMVGDAKKESRDLIERLGKSSWIGVCCNFWYEYSLGFPGGHTYGFDIESRTATLFDDGSTRINTTTWEQTARAVAKLLSLKISHDDANDQGPCLEMFRNKPLYISSFRLNQMEMLDSLIRATGTQKSDWTISHEPVKERFEAGREAMKKGDRAAFARVLYSRMFYPNQDGDYETTRGLHNDVLGLPREDLDERTKVAIGLVQERYYDNLFSRG